MATKLAQPGDLFEKSVSRELLRNGGQTSESQPTNGGVVSKTARCVDSITSHDAPTGMETRDESGSTPGNGMRMLNRDLMASSENLNADLSPKSSNNIVMVSRTNNQS